MQLCADDEEKRNEWVSMIEAIVMDLTVEQIRRETIAAVAEEEEPAVSSSEWVAMEHPEDGSTYYWNQVTNETAWEEPEGFAASVQAASQAPIKAAAAAPPPPGTYILQEGTTLVAEAPFKKQGGIRKNWKMRWWRLLQDANGHRLDYFDNKKDDKVLGTIHINAFTVCKV